MAKGAQQVQQQALVDEAKPQALALAREFADARAEKEALAQQLVQARMEL